MTFEVQVDIEMPQTLIDEVRQWNALNGPTYIPVDASDADILTHFARIRGVRGASYTECIEPEHEPQVKVRVTDEVEVDFKWDNS